MMTKEEKKKEEKAQMTNESWTFERDGNVFHGDFNTSKEAQEWADDAFAEECAAESPRNGQEFEEEIFLIRTDENGDEVERVKSTVFYCHYHGDHAEHFNQRDYI